MASNHDNPILEKSYKILKKISEEELELAYNLLFNTFESSNKKSKLDDDVFVNGKKTIAIDFDGVIHSYTSGYTAPGIIKDGPVLGAFKWLEEIVHSDDMIAVFFSSRCKYDEFKPACEAWLIKCGVPEDIRSRILYSATKPPAWLTVDDRAWNFTGDNFPTLEEIRNFKSWVNTTTLKSGIE